MRADLMVQQQITGEWQHMVAVMCLNLTTGVQVRRVLPALFKKYPTPQSFIRGNTRLQKEMIRSLGMYRIRLKRLKRMSREFLKWDMQDASDLHGIGKYGSDSYEIFFKNRIPRGVKDKELKKYIRRIKCL